MAAPYLRSPARRQDDCTSHKEEQEGCSAAKLTRFNKLPWPQAPGPQVQLKLEAFRPSWSRGGLALAKSQGQGQIRLAVAL